MCFRRCRCCTISVAIWCRFSCGRQTLICAVPQLRCQLLIAFTLEYLSVYARDGCTQTCARGCWETHCLLCLQMMHFSSSATAHCSPLVGVCGANASHTSRVASTQVSRISLLFRVCVACHNCVAITLKHFKCNHVHTLSMLQNTLNFA